MIASLSDSDLSVAPKTGAQSSAADQVATLPHELLLSKSLAFSPVATASFVAVSHEGPVQVFPNECSQPSSGVELGAIQNGSISIGVFNIPIIGVQSPGIRKVAISVHNQAPSQSLAFVPVATASFAVPSHRETVHVFPSECSQSPSGAELGAIQNSSINTDLLKQSCHTSHALSDTVSHISGSGPVNAPKIGAQGSAIHHVATPLRKHLHSQSFASIPVATPSSVASPHREPVHVFPSECLQSSSGAELGAIQNI